VDGPSPNNGFPRNIGGVTANNPHRKGTDGVSGAPNDNFVGNITVAMANYLRSSLNIEEFKNTNIIGNSSQWTNSILPKLNNVGLIGNYGSVGNLQGSVGGTGVIDILGPAPQNINIGTNYLNLWDNISRETSVGGYNVVCVRGTGGRFITTGMAGDPDSEAKLIVYSQKYDDLVSNATTRRPNHRAFINAGGQVKVTGPMSPAIGTIYLGSDSTKPVPSIVEEDWIKFGNGATSGFSTGVTLVNGTPQLATNYTNLSTTYKWNNADDFNTNAIASATPPHIDTWLADMPHALLEAVLDNRRRVYGGRG
jgi:uncharacterized protein YciI